MFDIFLSKLLATNDDNIDEPLITRRFVHSPNAKNLYIILPPWHISRDYSSRMRKKILESGNSVIEYKFSPSILSDNIQETQRLFKKTKKEVTAEIEKLTRENGYSKNTIIGVSISCAQALMIANGNKFIQKIVLVAASSNLGRSIWEGVRTQRIRKAIERRGTTLNTLEKAWEAISPESHIDKLKNKEIHFFLSRSDRIAPYHLAIKLVDKMKSSGLKPKIKTNLWLGHYGTVTKFYLFPKLS